MRAHTHTYIYVIFVFKIIFFDNYYSSQSKNIYPGFPNWLSRIITSLMIVLRFNEHSMHANT